MFPGREGTRIGLTARCNCGPADDYRPVASGASKPVAWRRASPTSAITLPVIAAVSSMNTARVTGSEVSLRWRPDPCVRSAPGGAADGDALQPAMWATVCVTRPS